LIQAIGLALSGYDVSSFDVFSHELDYFFGPDALDKITYRTEYLSSGFPLLIYNISHTTVFAFRGFATAADLAIQFEMLARYYIAPFLLDVTPWYRLIEERFLSAFIPSAHFAGRHWFSPQSYFDDLLQEVLAIYDEQGLGEESRVLFVGINGGGLFAKTMAMLKNHRGIGFVSLPVTTDEFRYRYDYGPLAGKFVSNVFNHDGWFGVEDEGIGENFALFGDPKAFRMDAVYTSFCNLAEMCGHHQQFKQYCEESIGGEALAAIRDYLGL
jgi:hypothetical protein